MGGKTRLYTNIYYVYGLCKLMFLFAVEKHHMQHDTVLYVIYRILWCCVSDGTNTHIYFARLVCSIELDSLMHELGQFCVNKMINNESNWFETTCFLDIWIIQNGDGARQQHPVTVESGWHRRGCYFHRWFRENALN
jgi:hypothetical protein